MSSTASHSLFVGAPAFSVPPGVTYKCFGAWKLPVDAGTLYRFQPEVDMSIVHHMILYGGAHNRSTCGSHILYAWARTGQTTPIGLDFSTSAAGLGFAVGNGLSHVSLQIHYQRTEATSVLHGDRSGIHLHAERECPVDVLLTAAPEAPEVPRTWLHDFGASVWAR